MIKREPAASIRPDTLIVRSFSYEQRCDYVDYKTRCNSIPVITRPLFSDLGNSRMSPRNLLVIACPVLVIGRSVRFSFQFGEELADNLQYGLIVLLYSLKKAGSRFCHRY